MTHIYEHIRTWKTVWTDLWPIGAAAWLTLRGPPSTLDTHAIGLDITFFFLFNSFFSASTVLFRPVLFQIARILIFWKIEKKIISFFESSLDAFDQSDPRKTWRDETDRTTFTENFFLKKILIFKKYYYFCYYCDS